MKPSSYATIATQYARAVVAGKITTCKWVLAACQRQLDDLDRFKGKESPYRFNPKLPATHPKLVDVMVVQQLELLERGSHRGMVRELIVLTQASGARHVGALIQASDPGADLGVLMASVAADLMAQKSLPNPQAEWEDALRRIEL